MEADPRKLFERLFGQGDTPQERKAIAKQYSSILDLVTRGGGRSAADARRAGPRQARRLPRKRARDRAARAEDGGAGSDQPRPARRARRARTFDQRLNLMFDMIALAYQANLTRVFSFMMAGEGSNVDLQPHRRVGRVPSAVASPERQGAGRTGWCRIQTYHTPGVREVPGQAGGDARRRRLDAGSLDPALRQQHEQQQRARRVPAADAGRRRRLRQDQGRPAPAVSRPHAARESAADAARPRRASRPRRSATARERVSSELRAS